MQNPRVSFLTKDAVVDTSYYKTLVIVGQSNTATAGLYKDIELKTIKQINTLFGAGSHLASLLRDNWQYMSNSIVKPKVWAISYPDLAGGVKRILTSVVSGTATEAKTLQIKLNSLNPDRTAVQTATVLALRNTKGAYAGDYAANGIEFGAPRNANMGFNPILADATTQDVVIEVPVSIGDTAATVATALNAAINAATSAIYTSTVATATLTVTANHKGALGQMFAFEVVAASLPAGIAIATTEATPGTGIVDATGILALTDSDSNTLAELDFNYITLPYGYSVTALTADAKAKLDNVLQYSNRCLEYQIFRGIAVDTSNSSNITTLASANPIQADGIVKSVFVSALDGLVVHGVTAYSERNALEAVQLSPIQKDTKTGNINVGNTYTFSDSIGFVNLERLLTVEAARQFIVEEMLPQDFQERNFTFGTAVNSYTYNKNDVISKFQFYRDILDGTNVNTTYASDYAGLFDNNSAARSRYDELLDKSVSFDKITKQLVVQLAAELTNPIKSIFAIAYYS